MSDQPKLATLEDLIAAGGAKRRYKTVALPVCGLTVRIRSLTEREVSEYQTSTVAASGEMSRSRLQDAQRRLMALCVVDGEGNRLIPDNQRGRLADWDSADAAQLYSECAAWTGIKRGELEELVKNSEATAVSG